MYELIILNSAVRQLRKFDKPIMIKLLQALDKIAENPFIGEQLKGHLTSIYSYHVNEKGVEYRIAYQINSKDIVVIVMQIGSRENFYEDLKKRI